MGSVGQSRDGVAKATYVIYNMPESSIELRRLDYDIAKAQKKFSPQAYLVASLIALLKDVDLEVHQSRKLPNPTSTGNS